MMMHYKAFTYLSVLLRVEWLPLFPSVTDEREGELLAAQNSMTTLMTVMQVMAKVAIIDPWSNAFPIPPVLVKCWKARYAASARDTIAPP